MPTLPAPGSPSAPPPPPPVSPAVVSTSAAPSPQRESIRDILISIIIAFALAFVFRGFVVEAFVIPTGSMAPTLMGAHLRARGESTGYSWPVGPYITSPNGDAAPLQSNPHARDGAITVQDPISHQGVTLTGPAGQPAARRAGDRILVLKYLYAVEEPRRYDVVVFKCPYQPDTNFIKRLVGLPGEEVALVDGDVFVRPAPGPPHGAGFDSATRDPGSVGSWDGPGWTIARKPTRVQRAVWQLVFDSRYTPTTVASFRGPWSGIGPGGARGAASGWKIDGQTVYEYAGAGPGVLEWNAGSPRPGQPGDGRGAGFGPWSIIDGYPYDAAPTNGNEGRFPVSDVRIRAGVEPMGADVRATVTLSARRHEFRALLSGGAGPGAAGTGAGAAVTLQMRPQPDAANADPAWTTLGEGSAAGTEWRPGRVTNVELWHSDQSLSLWLDGREVARGRYDWSPGERILYATGRRADVLAGLDAARSGNQFEAVRYEEARIRWDFAGGGVRLHRVGVDRDLHYQPASYGGRGGPPALGTHPLSMPALSADQFFVLGDNSPASLDARLWDHTDPWVGAEIDPTVGVVPRKLMMGKAFFVYFPAMQPGGPLPVPDFGRMRFIW